MSEAWQHLATLAAVTASLLGVYTFIKTIIVPFYGWCKRAKQAIYLHTHVLPDKVNRIYQEVTPNGGASLKDTIARIESRQIIQEQRQHAYASHLEVPIFETDAVGSCTWVNKAYLEFVNAPIEDVLGNGWINYIAYDDQTKVADSWASAVRDQRAFRLEYTMMTTDGPVTVMGETFVIRANHNGPVLGYIGTFTPVKV